MIGNKKKNPSHYDWGSSYVSKSFKKQVSALSGDEE